MMPYRIADLSPHQMSAIEHLENELGLTLVAWERGSGAARSGAEQASLDDGQDLISDALVDAYRTYDPH